MTRQQKTPEQGIERLYKPLKKVSGVSAEAEKQGKKTKSYYTTANTNASKLLSNIMSSTWNEVLTLKSREEQLDHRANYGVFQKGDGVLVNKQGKNGICGVMIPNFNFVDSPRSQIASVFEYIIVKVNEAAITSRELNGNMMVVFPVSELVNHGIYKSNRTAIKGLRAIVKVLLDCKVELDGKASNNKTPAGFGGTNLFGSLYVLRGNVVATLNSDFQWSDFFEFLTILPPYYFSLPKKAQKLAFFIFHYARDHVHGWAERGYFNLNFSWLRAKMGLPHEKSATQPARDIMNVILDAIEKIEIAQRELPNKSDLMMTPMVDLPTDTATFLNGYLKVEFSGEWLEYFKEIYSKRNKKVKQSKRRVERAKEKALERKILNDLSKGEKESDKAQ